jgi:hypothetical protein
VYSWILFFFFAESSISLIISINNNANKGYKHVEATTKCAVYMRNTNNNTKTDNA